MRHLDNGPYLVGFGRANAKRPRKVLWAGQITELMTFAEAYRKFQGSRYQKMLKCSDSPVHVKPIRQGGRIGYEHRSHLHSDWAMDLAASPRLPGLDLDGERLLLQPTFPLQKAFPRDVCALCQNLFFADDHGIPIDDEVVEILQQAQPSKQIKAHAIFGYHQNGNVDGLRGRWLPLEGRLAERLIRWISRKTNLPGRRPVALKHASFCS